MRTTLRIDDDLMRQLKDRAHREGTSLTRLINRLLRRGFNAPADEGGPAGRFHEKTFAMGTPVVNLDKSLALAASLEDEEVREELARRK
jgi:hypothetical protein